jgi:hypothetical protein
MRRKSIWLFGALSALLLAACSSPKPGTPEFAQKQEAEQQQAAVKNVEKSISKVPAWILNPPQDANGTIYTTGEGVSPRMQLAIDIAEGAARRDLAIRLGGVVSTKITQFAEQTGTAADIDVQDAISSATKTVALDKNVGGYVREKVELLSEGSNYKAFVLLRLPVGEANKVAADQVRKSKVLDTKLRASKAFQDLEQEIEAARKR